MLSKGHHFPHVTLAVVADGDIGLNLPDYRAAERTFQLLVQSSGRAGRGEKPGQVIIQTRDVNHYCWQYVKNGDYEGFYDYEIALRKRRRYPPSSIWLCCGFPTLWTGRTGRRSSRGLRLWLRSESKGAAVLAPRPRAAAAPAGTQAVSVPPQGWRLAIHPCPLCRACLSPRPRTCVFHWISTQVLQWC